MQLGPPCQQRGVSLALRHVDHTGGHVLANNIGPAAAAWQSWSTALPAGLVLQRGGALEKLVLASQTGPATQMQSTKISADGQLDLWSTFCSIMGTQLHEGAERGKAQAQAPVLH